MELCMKQNGRLNVLLIKISASYSGLYLHMLHQHQQSGDNYESKLAYYSIPAAGWHLRYTGHHPERLVHCQYQSMHCYMPCHLHVHTQYYHQYSNKMIDSI